MFMILPAEIVTCKNCKKEYFQRKEDPIEGSKIVAPDRCPYCRKVNCVDSLHIFFNTKFDR